MKLKPNKFIRGEGNRLTYQDKETTIFTISTKNYGDVNVKVHTLDWDRVKVRNWGVVPRRDKTGKLYPVTRMYYRGKKRTIYLHRFVMNAVFKKVEIDHEDNDTLNCCRFTNLRESTRTENARNQMINRKNNSSGYKGVSWNKKDKKWIACIYTPKRKHLGSFNNAKTAALIYNSAAIKHFGEFAKLNII